MFIDIYVVKFKYTPFDGKLILELNLKQIRNCGIWTQVGQSIDYKATTLSTMLREIL